MAETKSILRNKSAVEREQHDLDRKTRGDINKKESKKKKAAVFDEEEYMSAYYKVCFKFYFFVCLNEQILYLLKYQGI